MYTFGPDFGSDFRSDFQATTAVLEKQAPGLVFNVFHNQLFKQSCWIDSLSRLCTGLMKELSTVKSETLFDIWHVTPHYYGTRLEQG